MHKWKERYLETIQSLTNAELLVEYTELAGGDDYDGTYTARGDWKWVQIQIELHKRLKNWLETGEI